MENFSFFTLANNSRFVEDREIVINLKKNLLRFMDCDTKRTETLKKTTWNNLVAWLLVDWGNFWMIFSMKLQIFSSKFNYVISGWLHEGGGLGVWPGSSSHFLVKIVIFCLVSVLVIPINIETKCTTMELNIYLSRFSSIFPSLSVWYSMIKETRNKGKWWTLDHNTLLATRFCFLISDKFWMRS